MYSMNGFPSTRGEHSLYVLPWLKLKSVVAETGSACRLYLKGFPGTPSVACFHFPSSSLPSGIGCMDVGKLRPILPAGVGV